MLERAKAVTASGRHTYVEYARYADDLVILVHNEGVETVSRRLRRRMRARNRRGFGWKRWSTAWLYDTLGLATDCRA